MMMIDTCMGGYAGWVCLVGMPDSDLTLLYMSELPNNEKPESFCQQRLTCQQVPTHQEVKKYKNVKIIR
jgi:hypothetical protein